MMSVLLTDSRADGACPKIVSWYLNFHGFQGQLRTQRKNTICRQLVALVSNFEWHMWVTYRPGSQLTTSAVC